MSTIPKNKRIAIIGGGTNTYISNHLALSAPAYGSTAKKLANKFRANSENKMQVDLYLTQMAQQAPGNPDTPQEVEALIDKLVADPDTRVIIFNVAMVDYKPTSLFNLESNAYDAYNPVEITDKFGKYAGRLNTSKLPEVCLELSVQDKIIQKIRKERKDILLVGFKTTCGATKEEQYNKGLKLCKDSSANIVFVNDVDKDHILALKESLKGLDLFQGPTYGVGTYDPKLITPYISKPKTHCENEKEMLERAVSELQNNGLVTPEESSYWYNTRDEALDALVQMVLDRSHLHFTRSTVVDAETVPWNVQARECVQLIDRSQSLPLLPLGKLVDIPNPLIPETFRIVFDYVRKAGAYKLGPTKSTVGHFGIKLGPNEFLTSKRKTDFNKMEEVGLVRVITDDPDDVFGYKHFFETDEEKKLKELIKTCSTAFALGELDKEYRDNLEKTIMESQEKLFFISSKTNKSIQRIEKQLESIKDPVKLAEGKRFLNKAKEDYIKQLPQKENKVIAFGAKPSVGGQSQRSLFQAFPDLDCIIHFHCPLRKEYRSEFTTTPQFGVECGSHECGQNTAMNLKEFKLPSGRSVWAVHLDHHGPNIIFDSNTADPQEIIKFIATHWSLDKRTTGLSDELI